VEILKAVHSKSVINRLLAIIRRGPLSTIPMASVQDGPKNINRIDAIHGNSLPVTHTTSTD
jgi:hypothetical protein